MKKLLMALVLLPLMATAETWYDATTSLTWEYCLDGGATMKRQQPAEYGALPPGATIEQVSPSPVGALEIPSSINGYDVVAIDQNFLKQCETITSVSVPSTVREISCYAFYDCKNLREVCLSEGLELIAWKAFNRFKGPSVTLPSTLSVLFTAVLTDASVLQTVTFLGGVPKVVETHGNVLVFEGRPNLIVLVPRNKGWDEIVSMGTWQGSLIRYAGTSPQVGSIEVIPGEAVSIDTGLIGYTAKGLPSGLKYDKKTGKITGAAKKPTAAEGVTVKFTKRNEPDAEIQIVVGPMPKLSISLEGDTEKCKVKGAGAYLVGKKVSLSATAPKGTAFVGWFVNGAPWPSAEESKNAKLSYVMTKADVSLVAKFEKEQMSVGCAGLEGRLFTVGVAGAAGIPLEIETQSGVKSVKVSKLPAGMKYNAKTGLIEGAPTKAGDFTVQIAVTAKSGAMEKKDIAIRVDPLPDWAVGTFEGAVRQIDYDADGNVVFDGEDLHNWYDIVATVSVDAKGKISGKLTFPDKKTLAVKLNVLTAVEPGICIAEGDVMVKRQRYAVRAVFGAGSFQFADGVVAMGRCDLSIILQGQPTTCFRTDADCPLVQTFWSRKELKGRALQMGLTAKSGFDVENATGEDVEFSGVVKVSDKGVAKLTCTVNGTKSTASGTLLPVGPDVADGFAAYVSIKISRTSFRAVKLLFVPTAEGWVVKAVRW